MNQQTLCQRPHKSCGAPYVGVLIGCQQFQRHLRSLWFGDDRQDLHLRQIGSGPAVHPLMSRSWRSLGCYSCKGHVKVMEVWMLFGYTSRWIHKFFFFLNVLLFFFSDNIQYAVDMRGFAFWHCEILEMCFSERIQLGLWMWICKEHSHAHLGVDKWYGPHGTLPLPNMRENTPVPWHQDEVPQTPRCRHRINTAQGGANSPARLDRRFCTKNLIHACVVRQMWHEKH